jgi:hypothetical protein
VLPELPCPPSGGGLPSHVRDLQPVPGILDVVAVISNPVRYKSRYNLYRAWEKTIWDAGARLTTVELAYGHRPFEITEPNNCRHVQVRSQHELWHKENLINIGISRLPADARYIAWIDADVNFARHDWVQETLHQLQHHAIVQMFSHAQDLAPDYTPVGNPRKSFAACYRDGEPLNPRYGHAHPGFAWAARRETLDDLGGLIDIGILGSGDHHMGRALVGQVEGSVAKGMSAAYLDALRLWQERAELHVQRDLGVVNGLLLHQWHGKKANRFYQDRWKILVDAKFDPFRDLKKDSQGLWQLNGRNIRLRDGIRAYFRARDEDSLTI